MPSIDKRIVEMKFNNAAFERGVSKTMETIRSLKNALKFSGASKGLKDIESSAGKVNFSGIEKSLETISNRFSTFGIIGAAALQKITHSAMETGVKIVNAINEPLVEGGKRRALNIEQAKFQFEGLGINVKKAMDSALEAVSGTAYGLDEAARVASQFGASGMVAGREMTQSLRAVSGVAAMTGSGYSEIGDIFVQVAGQGKLMGDQLMQLSGRGINAAATLGKALGKSEAEVREMVTDGKISFETFYKAMDEAFGAHAKDANEVFTGALANMKAALSRIGADVATPAFRSLRNVFNTLTPVIDNVHKALGPLTNSIVATMKSAEKLSKSLLKGIKMKDLNNIGKGLNNLYKTGSNVFKGLTSAISPFVKGLKEALPPATTKSFKEFTKSLKEITSNFKVTEDAAESFKNVGKGIGNLFASVGNVFKALASYLKPIKEAIVETIEPFRETMKNILPDSLSGTFLKVTESIRNFTEGLKLTDEQSEKVKTIFKTLFLVIGTLLKPIGLLGNIVKKTLAPAFKLLGVIFEGIVSSIGKTVTGFVTLLSVGVNPLSKGMEILGPKIVVLMKKFKDIIVHTKTFQTAFTKVKTIVEKVTDVFSKSGPGFSGFAKGLKIVGIMIGTYTISALKKMIDYLPTVIAKIKEISSGLMDSSKNIKGTIGKLLKSAIDIFSNFTSKASENIKNGLIVVSTLITALIKQALNLFSDLPKGIESLGPFIVSVLMAIEKSITTILFGTLTVIGQFVLDVVSNFKDIFKYLSPLVIIGLKNIGVIFLNGLNEIGKSLGDFIKGLPNLFKAFGPWLVKTLSDGIISAGEAIKISLVYIVESLGYFINDMEKVAATIGPILLKEISSGFVAISSSINDFLEDILISLIAFAKEAETEAKKIGESIGLAISEALNKSSSPIAKGLQNLIVFGSEFSNSISKNINDGVINLSKTVLTFKDKITSIGKAFKDSSLEKISPIIDELKDKFNFLIEPVKRADKAIQNAFISIQTRAEIAKRTFTALFDLVKTVFTKIVQFLSPVGEKISEIFKGINIGDVLNTVSLVGLIKVFEKLANMAGGLGKALEGFLGSASGALNGVKKSLEGYQKSLKAKTLKEIAVAVAILAGSIALLSLIKPGELAAGLGAVTVLLAEVVGTMAILKKMIDDDENNTATEKKINKIATGMILISVAMSTLAGALRKLEGFDTLESVAAPMVAISALIAEMTAAMRILIDTVDATESETIGNDMIKLSVSMFIISNAISKLASACQKLGTMDTKQLLQGAGAIGALLTALVAFAALSNGRELDNVAKTLMAVSVSMLLLQKAVSNFGTMNFNVMATGLRRVAELMALLVVSVKLMNGTNIKGAAGSIMAISTALNLLIIPILALGSMKLSTLSQGLIAIGIAMGELVLAVNAMPSDSTKGAGAMVAMATALTILAVPIKVLGSMPLANLAAGIIAVGIALGGMTAVMYILAPLGASLITVAGAFALFGGAIALVGVGVAAFAVGLTTFAASAGLAVTGLMAFLAAVPMLTAEFQLAIAAIAAAAPAIGSSFEAIGDVVIRTISHLLQTLVTELINVLAKFASEVGKQAPVFVQAGVDIIKALLNGVRKIIPELVKTGVTAIKEFIKGIKQVIPDLVSFGVTLIKEFLKGVRKVIGDVVKTGVEIVKSFLKGLRELFPDIVKTGFDLIKEFLKGVRDNIKEIVQIAADIVVNFINGIASKLPDIVDSGINLAITFIESIADGIDKNKTRFVNAITKLFNSIINLIVEILTKGLPKMLKKGWELAKKLLEGIKKILPKLPGMALDLVTKLAKGIIDHLPDIQAAGGDLMAGFAKGVVAALNSVVKAAKKVASAAVDTVKNFLGIHSPSRVFMLIGEQVVSGFVLGTTSKKSIGKIVDAAKMMSQSFTKTVNQLTKGMEFGAGAVEAFYKGFVKGTTDLEAGNTALINMKNAVQDFAYQLYLQSDLYKQDQKDAKNRQKEYDKALKAVEKAEKNLGKVRKDAAKAAAEANKKVANSSKSTSKTVVKSNKNSEDSTKKATKSINDYSNAMAGAAKSSKKMLTAKEQFEKDQKSGIGKSDEKKKKSSKSSSSTKRSETAAKNQAKKNAENIKKAQQELKKAQKDAEKINKEIEKHAETVAKHVKQVYNELRNSIAEGVESFLDPLSMSLDSGIDIFSEFNKEYTLTSSELLNNMRSQNEGVRQWNQDLATLMERGLDEGIIQKLKEAGPQSAEQVHAFMQMSTIELKQANTEWIKANKLTAETVLQSQKDAQKTAEEWAAGIKELAKKGLNKDLLKSLGDAGVGSAEYVKAYLSMTPKQLKELNASYKKTMKLPKEIADEVIASYIVAGDKSLSGFVDGVSGKTSKGKKNKTELKSKVHKLMEFDDVDTNKPKNAGKRITEAVAEGIQRGANRTRDISEEFGKDVASSLTKGLTEEEKVIKETASNLKTTVVDGIKSYLKPLSMGLDSGIDIFKEFTKEYELTSAELIANMQSQNEGVRQWNQDLATLVQRGLDEGLVQKLKDAGPQSAEYVYAFLHATTEELNKANEEWKKANQLTAETVLKNQKEATKAAEEWASGITELAKRGLNKDLLKELGEAGVGSAEYVKAYLSMTPKQLKELNASYETNMKIPEEVAESIAKSYEEAGNKSLSGFVDGIAGRGSLGSRLVLEAKQNIHDLSDISNSIDPNQAKNEGNKIMSSYAEGLSEASKKLFAVTSTLGEDSVDAIKDSINEDAGKEMGSSMVEGISEGINTQTQVINKAIKNLKSTVSSSIKSFVTPLQQDLSSGIDIFKEFTTEYELTSKQLLDNMASQNLGVRQWQFDLEALVRKGLDEGIIKQLKEAGPQSAEQVHAFMQMSIEELEQANNQWRLANQLTAETVIENQKEATKAAEEWASGITELAKRGLNKDLLKELGEAGVGSAEYVKAYLSMTPKQIEEMNEAYSRYLTIPDEIAETIGGVFSETGEEAVQGFSESIEPTDEMKETIKESWGNAIEETGEYTAYKGKIAGELAATKMTEGFTEVAYKGKIAGEQFANGMAQDFEKATNRAEESVNRATEIGVKFADFIASGIKTNTTKMATEATNATTTAVEEATEATKEGMANAGIQATTSFTENVTTIGDTGSSERKEIKDTYVETTEYVGNETAKEAKVQGGETVEALAKGALQKETVVRNAFIQIGKAAFDSLRAFLNGDIGIGLANNIVEGIIIGFQNNEGKIQQEARAVALKALAAAKAALGIASPSKEFIKIGEYSTEGMVIGLKEHEKDVAKAGNDVGTTLLDVMKLSANRITSALNDDITGAPIITPVVDLSNVVQASRDIDASLSKSLAMKLAAETYANPIIKKSSIDDEKNATMKEAASTNNYSLVQNNYSPKELSRIDIYRDTKSLFAQFKRGIESA